MDFEKRFVEILGERRGVRDHSPAAVVAPHVLSCLRRGDVDRAEMVEHVERMLRRVVADGTTALAPGADVRVPVHAPFDVVTQTADRSQTERGALRAIWLPADAAHRDPSTGWELRPDDWYLDESSEPRIAHRVRRRRPVEIENENGTVEGLVVAVLLPIAPLHIAA